MIKRILVLHHPRKTKEMALRRNLMRFQELASRLKRLNSAILENSTLSNSKMLALFWVKKILTAHNSPTHTSKKLALVKTLLAKLISIKSKRTNHWLVRSCQKLPNLSRHFRIIRAQQVLLSTLSASKIWTLCITNCQRPKSLRQTAACYRSKSFQEATLSNKVPLSWSYSVHAKLLQEKANRSATPLKTTYFDLKLEIPFTLITNKFYQLKNY